MFPKRGSLPGTLPTVCRIPFGAPPPGIMSRRLSHKTEFNHICRSRAAHLSSGAAQGSRQRRCVSLLRPRLVVPFVCGAVPLSHLSALARHCCCSRRCALAGCSGFGNYRDRGRSSGRWGLELMFLFALVPRLSSKRCHGTKWGPFLPEDAHQTPPTSSGAPSPVVPLGKPPPIVGSRARPGPDDFSVCRIVASACPSISPPSRALPQVLASPSGLPRMGFIS
jgi:hypothetical protein